MEGKIRRGIIIREGRQDYGVKKHGIGNGYNENKFTASIERNRFECGYTWQTPQSSRGPKQTAESR